MLDLNHDALTIGGAFKFENKDDVYMHEFLERLKHLDGKVCTVSKLIESVWLDENMQDSAKIFLIFNVGRMYERTRGGRGL